MNKFKPVFVEARDLDDCWFQLLDLLYHYGRRYTITEGSYKGHDRVTFDFVSGFIHYPHTRPLAPQIPPSCTLPPPTTEEEIEKYFTHYLMDSKLSPNEHYRYSTWIVGGTYKIPPISSKFMPDGLGTPSYEVKVPNQIQWVIDHFKQKGYGNEHCYLTVGYPESSFGYDVPYSNPNERLTSPCLRGLDFRVIDGRFLMTHVVYRCIYGETPIFIFVDNVPRLTCISDVHDLSDGDHSLCALDEKGIPVPIVETSYREADNLMRISLEGTLPLFLTSNHIVPVKRGTSVSMVPVGQLRPLSDEMLELVRIGYDTTSNVASLDLLVFLGNQSDVTLRNLNATHFRVFREYGFKDSDRVRRSYPLKYIHEPVFDYPVFDNVRVGVSGSKYSAPRFLSLNYDFGYFCGTWLACGQFIERFHVQFSPSKESATHVIGRLSSFTQQVFNYNPRWIRSRLVFSCSILSKILRMFFNPLSPKSIPSVFFSFSNEFLRGLLDGWLDNGSELPVDRDLASDLIYVGKLIGVTLSVGRAEDSTLRLRLETSPSLVEYHGYVYIARKVLDTSLLINGCADVFDISVDATPHLFCCGGSPIVVHNSWDLVSGWPTNMGGFTLLNEYVASEVGVEPGPLAFSCKSLHCYDFAFDYIKERLSKK